MFKKVDVWLNKGEHRTYHDVTRVHDTGYDVEIYDERGQLLARITKDFNSEVGLKTLLTDENPTP